MKLNGSKHPWLPTSFQKYKTNKMMWLKEWGDWIKKKFKIKKKIKFIFMWLEKKGNIACWPGIYNSNIHPFNTISNTSPVSLRFPFFSKKKGRKEATTKNSAVKYLRFTIAENFWQFLSQTLTQRIKEFDVRRALKWNA